MPAVAAGPSPNGPGQGSRTQPRPAQLAVIGSEALAGHSPGEDSGRSAARVLELLSARYHLTLADPGAPAVARVLSIADQLLLVAPASADAARAIAMTMEWLEAHGLRRAGKRVDHGHQRGQQAQHGLRRAGRGRRPRPVPRDRPGALG